MEIKYYKIKFLKNVIERDLPALPVTIELRVNKAIQERLRVNPTKLGKPYLGDLEDISDYVLATIV